MNVNFELEAYRAMAPMPSGERLVLSTKDIEQYNKDFDDYMAKAYKTEDLLRERDILTMAEWVFAITGRLFIRVVREEHQSQASMPDENGVQFMVVNESDLYELFEITTEVLDGHYFN